MFLAIFIGEDRDLVPKDIMLGFLKVRIKVLHLSLMDEVE